MASEICQTDQAQGEGCDTLKMFLLQHQKILKTGVDPIYKILKRNEIDEADELTQFSEHDLRNILNPEITQNKEVNISCVHIGKLINVLRKVPNATICKMSNQEKVVIVLSEEEKAAMDRIGSQSIKTTQNINDVNNAIDMVNKNKIEIQKEINTHTALIIQAVHKRNQELTIQLDNIHKDKISKLSQQLTTLLHHQTRLRDCYSKCQIIVGDTDLDSSKRKEKILSNTKLLFDGNSILHDNFTLSTSADMMVNMCSKDAINAVQICGHISHTLPKTKVTIGAITDSSVTINIETKQSNITRCKVQYSEMANDSDYKQRLDGDMKLNWVEMNVNINPSEIGGNITIKSLKPSTSHIVRALLNNVNGFGWSSEIMTFCTHEALQQCSLCHKSFKKSNLAPARIFQGLCCAACNHTLGMF